MPPVTYLDGINEQGGGGGAAVTDTPIAPRVLHYSTPDVVDGAAAVASPTTNTAVGAVGVRIFANPPCRMLFWT